MTPNRCVFCDIINRTEDADILFEDDHCLAIYPLKLDVNDHLLVLPKKHVSNIYDIPPDTLSAIMIFTKQVCQELKEIHGYPAANILHASGKDAQQSVNHFHLHIMPRSKQDGLNTWPTLPGGRKTIQTISGHHKS